MIGAYRETLALLKLVDAPRWNTESLHWCTVSNHGQMELDWKISDRGWPWRALATILPGKKPLRHQQAWPMAWQQSLLKVVRSVHFLRRSFAAGDQHANNLTAKAWLQSLGVPQSLIDGFWKPLIEGALNTEFENACAWVLANVIHDSLCGPAGASSVITPSINLSVDGVDPILRWLMQRHVRVLVGHRVTEMDRESNTLQSRTQDSESIGSPFMLSIIQGQQRQSLHFDQVVMALPFAATLALWNRSGLPNNDAIARLRRLEPRAITTIWIALNSQQEKALAHLPSWFVLHPKADAPQFAQVVVRRPGVIAAVTSARRLQDKPLDQSELSLRLAQQLQHALGIDIHNCPQKWITEKSATWAATPQAQWRDPSQAYLQAQGITGVDGLWRCADDLEPGYPATIESAVRSGRRTAEAILSRF